MSQQVFDQADHLEELGKEEEVWPIWQNLAVTNPTRNVYLRLAGCARKLGRMNDAEKAFCPR